MKQPFIRVILYMFVILPVFTTTAQAAPDTNLVIKIVGSLPLPYVSKNVVGLILNTGDDTAYNISYNITVTGGFGDTIHITDQGFENEILPQNAFAVGIYGTYGFGPVQITLTVSAANAENVTGSAKGFQFFGYTWIPFSWVSLFFPQ